MNAEEKQLLIKDLCGRLPYSVWGLHRGEDLLLYVMDNSGAYMVLGYDAWFDLKTVPFKPYLRPMSSMTEEEENDLTSIAVLGGYNSSVFNSFVVVDWLNAHHFDYRGLIKKGLALEAPEGMYKTE